MSEWQWFRDFDRDAREAAPKLRYPEKPLAQIEEVASGTWGAEAGE